MSNNKRVDDILRKYGAKIEGQVQSGSVDTKQFSQSYSKFKKEMTRKYTGYEKWCHTLGNIIRINPSKTDADKVNKYLKIAHLDVEPWQAIGLGITVFLLTCFIGIFSSMAIYLITGVFPILFFILCIFLGMFIFYFSQAYPERLAKKWRLKASSQMVPAILYIVVYMRHTPNLEKAVAFAAEHLDEPLSLDFRKIFYDVEVGKYSTMKDSLDAYLETWRGYSTEFIEGFHLIESSLFEPDPGRRVSTLEKALQVVLDGVYDKMLKFSHSVRSPITNVYMLGVVMPTLGLALIPLASAMLQGLITSIHIFLLFNLIVPFFVFFLTDKILLLRPGGHGDTSLLERNPLYYKYKSTKPYKKALAIVLPLLFISLIPLIFQFTPLPEAIGLQKDYTFNQLGLGFLGGEEMFFGFTIDDVGDVKGPFGLGSTLLGLFFPLGIALFFSMAYKEKTKVMMEERKKTKELEREFNSSLFQLGNRLGNGVPPELVFARVAESNKGLRSGDFFNSVNYNIQQQGMSVESAIFDKERGSLRNYPSSLIATSMRVLVESAKKGLKIAAISLMSISEYVKNINKITIRLKDLLAEVTGDMKSNMTFLAPLLSGIVVGLSSMITMILSKFSPEAMGDMASSSTSGFAGIMAIFNYKSMIPPYFLQISVGVYLIEIIFILTATLVTIDSGEDKLAQTNITGKYLKKGLLLFFVTAAISTIILSVLGIKVLGNIV